MPCFRAPRKPGDALPPPAALPDAPATSAACAEASPCGTGTPASSLTIVAPLPTSARASRSTLVTTAVASPAAVSVISLTAAIGLSSGLRRPLTTLDSEIFLRISSPYFTSVRSSSTTDLSAAVSRKSERSLDHGRGIVLDQEVHDHLYRFVRQVGDQLLAPAGKVETGLDA